MSWTIGDEPARRRGHTCVAVVALACLLVSCTGRPAPGADDARAASVASNQGAGCARPLLDDPAALVAAQITIPQVAVSGELVNRFAAASRAMQAAAGAGDLATARCAAENVLYVLSGRFGRYGPPDALVPGTLPADRDPLSDPGLAITAMSILPDQPVADAIATGIVGSPGRWGTPTAAWSELDAAVTNRSVADLDSPAMQAIGYALLIQRAATIDDARAQAQAGATIVESELQIARDALASACAALPEGECRP